MLVRLSWLGFLPCFSTHGADVLAAANLPVAPAHGPGKGLPGKAASGQQFLETGLLGTGRSLPPVS